MTVQEKFIYDEMIVLKTGAIKVQNETPDEEEFWKAKEQIETADHFFDYLIARYGPDYPEE